jgi:hypothetical protein
MLQEICAILDSVNADDVEERHLPRTALYNEGWMLRLVLGAMKECEVDYPFHFQRGARWFSEALLDSPFLSRAGSLSNGLAESRTHADGVVGQFEFEPGMGAGLTLKPETTQFVVCEAKMFSPLSEGVSNARTFNQAARYVACMAETLGLHFPEGIPSSLDVGFYLLAPSSQIDEGVFDPKMSRESIEATIADRIRAYQAIDLERYNRLAFWEARHLRPLLDRLELGSMLKCVSWESIIKAIHMEREDMGDRLKQFYAKCRDANQHVPGQVNPIIGGRPVSGSYYQIEERGVSVVVRVIRVGGRNSRVERMDGVGPSRTVPNKTLSPIANMPIPIGGGRVHRVSRGGPYNWTDTDGTIRQVRVTNVGPANSRVRSYDDPNVDSFLVPNHTLTPVVEGG